MDPSKRIAMNRFDTYKLASMVYVHVSTILGAPTLSRPPGPELPGFTRKYTCDVCENVNDVS